jgi:SSS family solute:Na+ symporter
VTLIDWIIVLALLTLMIGGVLLSRGYMRGVADFLAAGRTAGRYVLTMSQGLAEMGAISIVALLEMNYVAGFAMTWWGFTMNVVILVITMSGWVVYRFRRTRALTLAEFFERRYSRRFRVFAGLVAFLAGLINFGIFPAVGARFFIHYCGLPASLDLAGFALPTFPLVMAALLAIALFFVFAGGQITVIVTDFLQGMFVNIVFVVVSIYLLQLIDWTRLFDALGTAPDNASLINPFKTSHVEDFNFWYFLIGVCGVIYNTMSWQGTQGYNASARNAHEARMGAVLTNWRWAPRNLVVLLIPVVAFTVMQHADFAGEAGAVRQVLDGVESEAVQNQLRVPLVLANVLPTGLLGAFAAVMLAAFISTHDTYLHSWGSIFVQDVIMPFRRRPLTPRQHLLALRLSILGVALFIFAFSLLFRQSEYIFLFFAITGAIFAGGSGAVIIGGLYWKHGTTAAAWTAMLVGSGIAVGGIVIHQLVDDFFINGQMFWALAMGASALSYVLVSLLGRRREFDLDRLLHRGPHALPDETRVADPAPGWGRKLFGMGREFSRGDRVIYLATFANTALWTGVFVVGTVYNLRHDVTDAAWAGFWKVYLYVQVATSALVIVWFSIGGMANVRSMLRRLDTMQRDPDDDGRVRPDR